MVNSFKVLILFSFTLLFPPLLTGQENTLAFDKTELEALFLQNNLSLLAENLSISKAEAMVIQAKVWPNPTISIDEVNLWRPKKAIGNEELIPPISGNFGRNQQFTVGFEQLIITAGKRKKLIELNNMGVEYSKQYFEEILRSLKVEFRSALNQMNYLQNYKSIYESQLVSINQLMQSYKNQVDKGFLNKGEYIRLKALSLEIQNELNQLENEFEEVEHEVKLLVNIPVTTPIKLKPEGMKIDRTQLVSLDTQELIDSAQWHRPEYKLSKLEEEMANQSLSLARSERVPDFSILGEYNRGDGLYRDFVGFGIAFDLPVFNRNRGNIKQADIEIQQSQLNQTLVTRTIEKEISLAVSQFRKALDFTNQIEEEYESELDQILNSYTQNFTDRNISLLEYLDFLEAYLENKRIILQSEFDLRSKAEELNYAIGKDLIK